MRLATLVALLATVAALPVDVVENDHPVVNGDGIMQIEQGTGVADGFEDDLQLTEEQLEELNHPSSRTKRQAYRWNKKWLDNTVYYYFDGDYNAFDRDTVNLDLDNIRKQTCINFVESSTAANRIRVYRGGTCNSYPGMKRGVQGMSLDVGCVNPGTVSHEFMHALGFFHTHQRPDRDEYITVNFSVIPTDDQRSFEKKSQFSSSMYVPYDYGSVLHYNAGHNAINNAQSMIPKNSNYTYTMGSPIVSFYDLKAVNDYYGCTDLCSEADNSKCQNEGVANPRNCNVCICPLGYGGDFCDIRSPGCGKSLSASSDWKTEQIIVGDVESIFPRDHIDFCNHWIEAPDGHHVELKFIDVDDTDCSFGCPNNGIEIKLGNKTQTNPRHCCKTSLNKVFTSELNPTPLISYSRISHGNFTIQYRAVLGAIQTSTTPAPTSAPCEDFNQRCPQLDKDNNFCAVTPESRKKLMCKKTCGYCSTNAPTTQKPATCVDLNQNCPNLDKEKGYCKSSDIPTSRKKMMCAKTCNLCSTKITTTPKPTTVTTPSTTSSTTIAPSTTSSAPSCFDTNKMCPELAKKGYCTMEQVPLSFRKRLCSKTCKFC